jgi:hypothetical protein
MDFLKVEGHDGLLRDTSNGAIINTNKSDYTRYMKNKLSAAEKQKQIVKNTEDIDSIKKELSEMKSLILQLLNK